jgi:excisionase family DNA binding protein
VNNGRSYDDSDYVSTSVAAQMLGFHRNTIVQRIKNGKIKAHRVEREYRIAKSEIQRIKEGRITD